ncbi:MAG TPA: hypothetical protein VK206_25990 [Anaerolineales bacterium]|nr:hypothetical protein [Anaerolineales bacterium]
MEGIWQLSALTVSGNECQREESASWIGITCGYALEGTTTAEMVTFLDEVQYVDSTEISFGEYYKRWKGYGTYQP